MKHLLFLFLALFSITSVIKAQDTEFWFAAPDLEEYINLDGPMMFGIANNTDRAGTVTITRYNGGGSSTIVDVLPISAGGLLTHNIPLTQKGTVENPRGQAGNVTEYGIHIHSTVPVTAYYQTLAEMSQDVFALKGSKALGNLFYVSMISDGYYYVLDTYPGAYRQIDIVATEADTEVKITPTKQIRIGASGASAANTEITRTLGKGQTLKIMEHARGGGSLAGTKIVSNKPIAVTSSEDMVSGPGAGHDLVADQIVPVSSLGNDYVVVKGYFTGRERVYLLATENNTEVKVNNKGTITTLTANAGGRMVYDLGASSMSITAALDAVHITSNHPIYCYHISGYSNELGSGLLPSIYSISQTRLLLYMTPGNNYGTLLFRAGHENDFTMTYDNVTTPLNITTPIDIAGLPDWKAAKYAFPAGVQSKTVAIENKNSPFSFGYLSPSPSIGGASYGYFSAFGGTFNFPHDTIYTCDATTLQAGFSDTYEWKYSETYGGPYALLSGETSYSLVADKEGHYVVNMQIGLGAVTTDTVFVGIVDFQASITPTSIPMTGTTTSFSSSVNPILTGDPNLLISYNWVFEDNGVAVSTSTSATPTVTWSNASSSNRTAQLTLTAIANSLGSTGGCSTSISAKVAPIVAIDDNFSVFANSSNNVMDVANNDSYQCATPTIEIVSTPTFSGTASVSSSGITYTPPTNFVGTETLRYRIYCDDVLLADTATVSITIIHNKWKGTTASNGHQWDIPANWTGNRVIVDGEALVFDDAAVKHLNLNDGDHVVSTIHNITPYGIILLGNKLTVTDNINITHASSEINGHAAGSTLALAGGTTHTAIPKLTGNKIVNLDLSASDVTTLAENLHIVDLLTTKTGNNLSLNAKTLTLEGAVVGTLDGTSAGSKLIMAGSKAAQVLPTLTGNTVDNLTLENTETQFTVNTASGQLDVTSIFNIAATAKGIKIDAEKVLKVIGGTSNLAGASALIIGAELGKANGTFITANGDAVNATVLFVPKGKSPRVGTTDMMQWQYFGIPVTTFGPIGDNLYGLWIREYVHATHNHWVWKTNGNTLTATTGYEVSIPEDLYGNGYAFTGSLVTTNQAIPIGYTATDRFPGEWVISNPFTAAINVGTGIDFSTEMQATAYLFGTGTSQQWNSTLDRADGIAPAAGQYLALPQGTLGAITNIPSMQGFVVKLDGTTNGTVTLNYAGTEKNDRPMYVGGVESEVNPLESVQSASSAFHYTDIQLLSPIQGVEGQYDRMWIFVDPTTTRSFDNGYDGRKMFGAAKLSQLYAVEADGDYQVNAVPDMQNTSLNMKAEEGISDYILRFSHHNMENKYGQILLTDLMTNTVTDITKDGSEYAFTATNEAEAEKRFLIGVQKQAETEDDINTTTDIEIVQKDGTIYINNRHDVDVMVSLYNTVGQLFMQQFVPAVSDHSIPESNFATGVYVIKATAEGKKDITTKIIVK